MRKASFLALALAMALPAVATVASADDLNYTYVEAGYEHVDSFVDANGAYIRGSYAIGQGGMYATGSYADLSNDIIDIDPRPASLGLGYHHDFSPRLHGLAEVAYEKTFSDIGDAEGYRASLGVRAALGKGFEGLAKVNYRDGADYASDTTGTIGLQYRFNDTWGLASEVEFGTQDSEIYTLGIRANF